MSIRNFTIPEVMLHGLGYEVSDTSTDQSI